MSGKKKELYELIFRTAADEFAAYGYAGARMDRIAETARVNKATIYYHLGNKDKLYNNTVEYLINRAAESLRQISYENGRGNDVFHQYIRILGKTLFDDLKLPLIMIQEIVSGKDYLKQETIEKFMELFSPVIGMITRGQKEGRFRKKPPLLVHFMAVASLYFFTAGRDFLEKNNKIIKSGLPGAVFRDKELLLEEVGDILLNGFTRR